MLPHLLIIVLCIDVLPHPHPTLLEYKPHKGEHICPSCSLLYPSAEISAWPVMGMQHIVVDFLLPMAIY